MCMTTSTEELLRMIIREEIGRNYHTIDNSPYSYSEFPGYDVSIHPTHDGLFLVSITFEEKPIGYDRHFASQGEADLYSRQTVDRHRLNNG